MNKKFLITTFLIIILITIILFLLFSEANQPSGIIVYRRIIENSFTSNEEDIRSRYQYILVDYSKKFKQHLGYYLGMPSISNNGDFLAVNDWLHPNQVKFIDLSRVQNSEIIEKALSSEQAIKRGVENSLNTKSPDFLELPESCFNLMSEDFGLQSISWNYLDSQLAVVCGDLVKKSDENMICVFQIEDGTSSCWEEKNIEFVNFSPKNNDLLLTIEGEKSEVFLTNIENTSEKIFLFEGQGADWSPDGKKIVYTNDGNIYIYSLKKQKSELLYEIKEINNENSGENYVILLKPFDPIRPVLSWSPDGRFISFHGILGRFSYKRDVFIMDIRTKTVRCVSCFEHGFVKNTEPTWGK